MEEVVRGWWREDIEQCKSWKCHKWDDIKKRMEKQDEETKNSLIWVNCRECKRKEKEKSEKKGTICFNKSERLTYLQKSVFGSVVHV